MRPPRYHRRERAPPPPCGSLSPPRDAGSHSLMRVCQSLGGVPDVLQGGACACCIDRPAGQGGVLASRWLRSQKPTTAASTASLRLQLLKALLRSCSLRSWSCQKEWIQVRTLCAHGLAGCVLLLLWVDSQRQLGKGPLRSVGPRCGVLTTSCCAGHPTPACTHNTRGRCLP